MEELIELLEKKRTEYIEEDIYEFTDCKREKVEGILIGYKWALGIAIEVVKENRRLFKDIIKNNESEE